MIAMFPPNRSRSKVIPYAEKLYKERRLVKYFINKIRHFYRTATRYVKTAASYLSMLLCAPR